MGRTPRLFIAGTSSGCGKTTIVCGLLAALKQKGMKAASCKSGPDYIDPMFHSQVFGISSKNLDLFFSDKDQIKYLLEENGKGADVTIMEGTMGFYDGMQMDSTTASSYDVAKKTRTPTVLVVNCRGMALSVIPLIKGFLEFRNDHTIKGVILNGVTKMTGKRITNIIENELSVKVYGCVPKLTQFQLSSRHLGLVTPLEQKNLQTELVKLGELFLEYVDLDGLVSLAQSVEPLHAKLPFAWKKAMESKVGQGIRIGVAWDKAFCFYYKENLYLLEKIGCKLIRFSPIADKSLPEDIDVLLLGGGYPELYAKQLAQNISLLEEIQKRVQNGLPCLAECGGFMYLHDQIEDEAGNCYTMAGVIRGKVANQKKLVRFGYTMLKSNEKNPFLLTGETIKAHEFHYWDSTNNGKAFLAEKPSGKRSWFGGHVSQTMIAGFAHLYYLSNPDVIIRFIASCRNAKEKE